MYHMNKKFIFVILCIGVICIIFLTTLKIKNTYNSKHWDNGSHYLRHPDTEEERDVPLNTKLLIEPKCDSSIIVWIVTSSAEDSTGRIALRHAYSNDELKKFNIRRVFLLGIPKSETATTLLQKESLKYGDVLQGNFLEAYRNLTLKHLMGLKWASENCIAHFLIKTDDDIVINLFQVLELLEDGEITDNVLSGYALKGTLPIRTPGNKWFVTREEFAETIYPNYLSGWFYITSLQIVQKLILRSRISKKSFWIDDIYITGILRQECGITIKELNNLYATDYRYLECCIRGMKRRLRCEFIAGPDGGKRELQLKFKEYSAFCRWNCVDRMKGQSVAATCVTVHEESFKVENAKAQIYSLSN